MITINKKSYEEKQDLVPDIYGIELIKALMVELDLKQKDLIPIFKTESIVSDVLKGKRKMTVEHIQAWCGTISCFTCCIFS